MVHGLPYNPMIELGIAASFPPCLSHMQFFLIVDLLPWPVLLSRVTKGKGKKLRVEVRCNFAFQWKELYVTLVDMISGVDAHQDFSIDTKKSKIEESDHVYVALIEVNLVKICKKLCFRVNLTSRFGWTCEGRSVPFTTHNNGKDKYGLFLPFLKQFLSLICFLFCFRAQNGPTTPEGECIPSSPYPSSHPSPSSTPPR